MPSLPPPEELPPEELPPEEPPDVPPEEPPLPWNQEEMACPAAPVAAVPAALLTVSFITFTTPWSQDWE